MSGFADGLASRLPLFGDRRAKVTEPESEGACALRILRGLEQLGTGWFWETDADGALTYLSQGFPDQAGVPPLGRALTDIFEAIDFGGTGERPLGFHLRTRTSFREMEVRLAGAEGSCWSLSGRCVVERGRFHGFVGSGSDLAGRRRAEAEIQRLAHSDPLTGLANRVRMRQHLNELLARQPESNRAAALMMLDLDRFKEVNDTLGHQVGDALLAQVGQRLQRAFGETGFVGRIGGDEFNVLLPGQPDRARLTKQARDAIAALSQPYLVCGSSITIGCSVGVALVPDDGGDAETLARNADLALYAAKAAGRGTFSFFRQEFLQQAQQRRQLEDDLREALTRNQLSVVYQPVVNTASGEISGYEALVRWTHPRHGVISPANFIPVAEEAGLIDMIGGWVLRTATAAAARWPSPVRIAVNVSPIQFAKPGFAALVASALAAAQLAPDRLELEITESVFLGDGAAADPVFRALKALGVRLALDDFGTGYSSLGRLKDAPFDKLKIDQSFVRGAKVAGSRDIALIKAIVTLAQTLGLETTAEGVEAQDEIAMIRELGCTHIQGYVYGRPAPEAEVLAMLGERGPVEPIGVKISRPSRVRTLRAVALDKDGARHSARLRNISLGGARIDQVSVLLAVDDRVEIELANGEFVPAQVRWVEGDNVGLKLLREFDYRAAQATARAAFGRAAHA